MGQTTSGGTEMVAYNQLERGTLWCEEMNRARHEIQSKWTEAERSHRRQLAECRQQALARALMLMPFNKSRSRQPA
jgi:hypothetical protein